MSSRHSSEYPGMADTPENQELDEAFTKLNTYLFVCNNTVLQKLLLKSMEELTKEAIKRDSRLTFKLNQYMLSIKGMFK